MKFSKTIALALAAGVVASSAFAQEEEEAAVGAYAGTVYKNGYISNGYLFADEQVLQSYAGITFLGFDLNVWNSYGLEDHSYAQSPASEIDYELDYRNSFEDFDYMLGVAAWCYPHTDDSFDEWVGKIAVGYNGWVVRPELNARFGLEGQQGCYGQFKLSKGFDIGEDTGLSANVYGLIGAASKSYRAKKGVRDSETGLWLHKDVDKDGFVDAEFGASITYSICDNASINVGCQYAVVVDGDLRDYCDEVQADGDEDHFMYFVGADIWF